MTEEDNIPIPIRFNAFKHHRNYILQLHAGTSAESLVNRMVPLCNNYIDIYTGHFTPSEIANKVINYLLNKQVLQPDNFHQWVKKTGHQAIQLDDHSIWILRQGNEAERYIHIHPARTGKHTIRFKGSTLKTAYLLYLSSQTKNIKLSVSEVNQIRSKVGLSPVKKLERDQGILKCYNHFFDPNLLLM